MRTQKLAQNAGVIASFSRALTEGLSALARATREFDAALGSAIDSIFDASRAR
jgi:fructose-bisphosphate aldolase class I